MKMNALQLRDAIEATITQIVPDADFSDLGDDENLRQYFELDSLDFLAFVEGVSGRTGCAIGEDDYPALTTMGRAVSFLLEHGAEAPVG
jgi:acyl carrier protein